MAEYFLAVLHKLCDPLNSCVDLNTAVCMRRLLFVDVYTDQ